MPQKLETVLYFVKYLILERLLITILVKIILNNIFKINF